MSICSLRCVLVINDTLSLLFSGISHSGTTEECSACPKKLPQSPLLPMTKIITEASLSVTITRIVRTALLGASLPKFVEHSGNQTGEVDAVWTCFTGSICFECFRNACHR